MNTYASFISIKCSVYMQSSLHVLDWFDRLDGKPWSVRFRSTDDKPWGSSLREKLPQSVRLRYVNWGSKECQQMLLRRQERWRRRSVLRRHGPWRHRGGGARTPLCWQSPWRRSSVLRCQGSWRSSYRGASALGAAVLRCHGSWRRKTG